ncbi:MAG TPA: alpha-ribazole phosphatase [Flavisolibacter sp.]|nr:alpha-ribazole phosphatase [Flavisolibacter sp.]
MFTCVDGKHFGLLFVNPTAMEIYLIRHTTPLVEKGTCYGQADLDVTESFKEEAACILPHLPSRIEHVVSSPLKRCRKLAQFLFPKNTIQYDDRIKEIHCGHWELQPWDLIDRQHLDPWMADVVNVQIPGGESYVQLHQRVVHFFEEVTKSYSSLAIVAHGGVLRSLLAHINGVQLKESFDQFTIRYGCVVKVHISNNRLCHAILHNPETPQEQHRPSYY